MQHRRSNPEMEFGQRDQGRANRPQKKLRSACDSCHQNKVRCSGDTPCRTCENLDMQCVYSVSNRIGRPRGTKNKKTLDRLNKAGESEQQNQRKAEPAEDETMQRQNNAAQEVFSSGGMHPQLSELQTQMGTNQSCGPLSAGITPDLDTLDLSLPDGDDSLLAMLDSTASWPIYNDLAGFSTSGVRLLQNTCSRVLMGK